VTEFELMELPAYRDAVRSPAADEPRIALVEAIRGPWPARAEHIDVQMQMRRLACAGASKSDEYGTLVWRDLALYEELAQAIEAPFRALGYARDPGFRRGLIGALDLDADAFVIHGVDLVSRFPITAVVLEGPVADAAALAGSPALRHITSLGLNTHGLGDDGIRQIVASPHLGNLRRLSTYEAGLGRRGYEHVIEATQTTLAGLEMFSSSGNATDSPQERQPSYDSISGFPVYETVGFLPEEGDALEAKYGYQKVLHWCSRFGPELEKWPYE
jgi:hypothetical protein